MTQTVFSENSMTWIREEVFEATLRDWAIAWHNQDVPALDRLSSFSMMVSGPERHSDQSTAAIVAIFLGLQTAMLKDVESGSFRAPPELKKQLIDSIARCKTALGQLERGGRNGH